MNMSGQHHFLAALTPGKDPGTHLIGGWMNTTAVLDGSVKRKIFVHARIRIPVFGDL